MQRRQLLKLGLGAGSGLLFSRWAGAQSNQTTMTTTATTPQHLQNTPQGEFKTQPWADQKLSVGSYRVERVVWKSQGTDIVGNLFIPEQAAAPHPAVVIIGPVAFVKEQSPIQYASRLVREGFATLVFDPRYHGESSGEPRRFESRQAKVQDLQSALDYLSQRPDINKDQLNILGVCQGVNWAIEASTLDKRVKALSIVAGHYLTPAVAEMYLGSADKVKERIQAAQQAKQAFEKDGKVEYIPIINDPNALLTAPVIGQFYQRWADRGAFWDFHGLWENRITRMSEAEIWGHDIASVIPQLNTPTLMVHANKAASGPKIPRELFELIPSKKKELLWLADQNQMMFYEDPLTIDQVSQAVAKFYKTINA
jgi:hypothetical protein